MKLQHITLSPARRAAILQQAQMRRRPLRRTAARVLLAAVLAVLLTFSALAAAVPALREALKNALGGFAEQSQPITGITIEDNGIEVRPVAALSSSNLVRVWVEVQDKTGDRLSEDMRADGWLDYEQDENAPVVNGWTGGAKVAYYDGDSRTALIEIKSIGRPVADGTEVDVSFSSFQPSARAEETVDFPREMLSATGLKNLPMEDVSWMIYEILPLVPEQTPHELEGTNHARLSSVGFGEDGKLHIQTVFADGADHWSGFHSEATDSRDPDAILMLGGHSFQYNDTWYYEAVYDVTPDDLPYLTFSDLTRSYYVNAAVEGVWHFTIAVETADEVVYHPNVQVGGALVKEIRVSEIGVSARSASEGTILGHRPTYAMTKSGEKLYLTDNCIDGGWSVDDMEKPGSGGHAHDQWMFDEPLDPSEIVLLNFDGVDVPLQ
nr:hypothetical protein [uncultured Agathobaculum sp.]